MTMDLIVLLVIVSFMAGYKTGYTRHRLYALSKGKKAYYEKHKPKT